MTREEFLSKLIEEKGLSRRAFAELAGIPATTLQSMLTRGVGRASVENVIKVCRALGITVEDMERAVSSSVEPSPEEENKKSDIHTIAAHHDGEEWTEEELEEIERFKEFVRMKRKQKQNE